MSGTLTSMNRLPVVLQVEAVELREAVHCWQRSQIAAVQHEACQRRRRSQSGQRDLQLVTATMAQPQRAQPSQAADLLQIRGSRAALVQTQRLQRRQPPDARRNARDAEPERGQPGAGGELGGELQLRQRHVAACHLQLAQVCEAAVCEEDNQMVIQQGAGAALDGVDMLGTT